MRSIVYPIAARPEVEVNVGGTWHCGQLRMWTRHTDGAWWAQVTWWRATSSPMATLRARWCPVYAAWLRIAPER